MQGGVAAGNRDTAAAAAAVLRSGGSAVDGVLAAGFAAAVAEPGLSSLGGGGFLLDAPVDGLPTLVDFFVDVPGRGRAADAPAPVMEPIVVRFSGADQVFSAGWGSVAVPGCLAGYLHVHQRRGTLPLAEVVEPARRLACDGVRLDRSQAGVVQLLAAILTLGPEGRRIFAPDGPLLVEGDRLANPQFADFLGRIAAGEVVDLTGVADELDEAMVAGGGAVTGADLAAYRVEEREPLTLDYRGGRIATNPPPSFGGTLVSDTLLELAAGPRLDAGPETVARYARALVAMTIRHLTGAAPARPVAVRGTTHVSVVDGAGNVAAMTTSNGSCSGVYVPGTGIQLNNMMGEQGLHPAGLAAAEPGRRVGSMMMPTVVVGPDGTTLAAGSGGSERIPAAMARVLTGFLDRRLPLTEVIDAPRLHWDGAVLQVEPRLPADVVDRLRREHPVAEWTVRDLYFGGAHAVARRPEGIVEAAADPRRGGTALVVDL